MEIGHIKRHNHRQQNEDRNCNIMDVEKTDDQRAVNVFDVYPPVSI